MKKWKSIYEQPKRYAKKCNIPIKYARQICKKHLKLERELKKNSTCPYCHKRALFKESSGGEWYDETWLECDNCGKVIDEVLFPKITILEISDVFDVILWAAHDKDMQFESQNEWITFVKEHM